MIVSTWTRTEVRALRDAALRMTQEEFAEALGFKVETIQKWEQKAAEGRPVKGRSAEALDTAYAQLKPAQRERFWSQILRARPHIGGHPVHSGTTAEEMSAGPDPTLSGPRTWEVDDDVRRREFGKLATVAGAAVLVPNAQGRIGMADVQRLLRGVDALGEEDQRVGGAGLVDFAVDQLARAKSILETCAYDTATGNAFTSATGELAVLTGWLAFDADRHELARRCYADAMALGTEADDADLIAHTCLNAAHQSIALARSRAASPYKALKLVDRARDLMRGRPPGRIHALIAAREAAAQGVLGDRAAFGRAITTAWREMDAAAQFEPTTQCPQWIRFVTHFEIGGHEARGYGSIGEVTREAEFYTTMATERAGNRNAINLQAWAASSRVSIGDVHGAIEQGLAVLEGLSTVSSTRTLRALEPVRRAANEIANGSDFRDRYDALNRKAAAV
ncbi:helix-turn-helix domain-containing protein [Nocardia wallacei]|uniref:helix-turn-helix domain-containing protein n=1 Tax=Nocardia wallacei TaxID=480035 RepID=UPI002457FC5B|nr:helix-turn-helix domain-containing protein [Nocardia wallacei]